MKRFFSLLCAALTVISLSACGGKEPPAPAESSAAVSAQAPEVLEEPAPYVPSGTNPLTGLPMEPEYETLRPVAVMLNNLKEAQPQLGPSSADIIYEVTAEGGITRMLALYQTLEGAQVGELGSVRSSRPYYIELALGHDALYVHAGGSPEAYSDLSAWNVDNMDGVNGGSDAEIFWRDKERRKTMGYEHSMITSGENILAYLDKGRFSTEHKSNYTYGQKFVDDATPLNGELAEHVRVKFSVYKTGTFEYDAQSRKYLVGQYDAPYVDKDTGEQVAVTNLLVLETNISVISGDSYGRMKVRTTGEGDGAYFCGGKTISIHWSRANRNSPFVYTTQGGTPLNLERGNSYVCIISPKTGAVEAS
ncbi:DUF3048 domain-containing protein [Oscillibacter sp.]|uniref:DUF3048 domain-containing protein n=1 Tax=Oscillibacter sp. TaxID=1945593 RepID=UPI0028A08338|nr:DUF3048 domain-containing protein [Oscillibacter sp.]